MFMVSPDAPQRVPPDPTRYDHEWGEAYPCLQMSAVGQHAAQCPGKMIPAKRCIRDYEGRLWRIFTCNKCGRKATDWKVNEDVGTSAT